jgi:rSAM/selenodomain-associated transferase 1
MPWSNGRTLIFVDNPVDKVDNSPDRHTLCLSGRTIAVFAKQPIAGRVKTRFCPPLSATEACQLYDTALRETVVRLLQIQAQVVLCYAGRYEWFAKVFPGLFLLPQAGADLGQRLSNASRSLFAAGANPLVIIGSDCPDLPVQFINQAIVALEDNCDVVTVPCRDGGYALIGQRRHRPEVFDDIPWSSSDVLTITRMRAAKAKLRYVELSVWEDLDDVKALSRLLERSPNSRTAEFVRHKLSGYLKTG